MASQSNNGRVDAPSPPPSAEELTSELRLLSRYEGLTVMRVAEYGRGLVRLQATHDEATRRNLAASDMSVAATNVVRCAVLRYMERRDYAAVLDKVLNLGGSWKHLEERRREACAEFHISERNQHRHELAAQHELAALLLSLDKSPCREDGDPVLKHEVVLRLDGTSEVVQLLRILANGTSDQISTTVIQSLMRHFQLLKELSESNLARTQWFHAPDAEPIPIAELAFWGVSSLVGSEYKEMTEREDLLSLADIEEIFFTGSPTRHRRVALLRAQVDTEPAASDNFVPSINYYSTLSRSIEVIAGLMIETELRSSWREKLEMAISRRELENVDVNETIEDELW